ncbi:uracil-DNA glycosylase [Leishmania donovani]|uniref:Uracil-DNA glycosylase n=1 Tax=Leishmania donovani TaxID=5661 RepID=A0A504Y3P5_LEIDO|nr:uracil-DNA glycosylase [Leishmania donovani]
MSAAVTWLQNSLGIDVTGEWARHVHLNVGGTLYTTRRYTLRELKDHRIFGPILDGHAHRCEDGSFLIDRDGSLFRYIIAYLRDGRLSVPDNFVEWDMLLQEVRYYELPAMEKSVMDRFEFQQSVFRRQLPHGVYVWWPPASSHIEEGATDQTRALEKEHAEAAADAATRSSAGVAPSSCSSASLPIRIVPPLPGLTVEAASGRRVVFRETQVLEDLDQLVTVLLTAYGFSIQHWDAERGRGGCSRGNSREREGESLKGASRDDAIDLDASVSVALLESTFPPSEDCGAIDKAKHWRDFLAPITADSWRSGAFARIERFLDGEKEKGRVILPPATDIFNAFNSCPFRGLKVVLLGQDPYHDLHQAHGLCFSVLPEVALPPSLRNIYKELTTDIAGFQAPRHGYLQSWSEQGMLMLNATLTVEAHKANSHSKTSGWTAFTDAVIQHLSQHHPNRLVFLLWGGYAQQKKKLIDASRHIVLESVHPSPLSASRGWFGCHCFSACNAALQSMGHLPMHWQLPLNASLP